MHLQMLINSSVSLTDASDGLHHRGRHLRLSLLPLPLLHGFSSLPQHQREEDVSARHVQGQTPALRGRCSASLGLCLTLAGFFFFF